DPSLNRRIEMVEKTIAPAKIAYFEILTDNNSSAKAVSYMRLPPGKTLQSILGDALFKQAAAAMQKRGLKPEVTNALEPWAVGVMIQLPPQKAEGMVVDDKLQLYAMQHGMAVKALEEIDEHFRIFTGLAQGQQIEMLREALIDQPQVDQMNKELEEAY